MDISPIIPADRQVIDGYGGGGFRVGGARYRGSLLVFPDRVEPWPVAATTDLSTAAVDPVIAAGTVELLLIGTGARQTDIPGPVRMLLAEAGIAVEIMDTGAACRTYNVLMAEGRQVAAALVAIP